MHQFANFKVPFESEQWSDLDRFVKSLKGKPLSRDNLTKYILNTVERLIDTNKITNLSELDKMVFKKLGQKVLEDNLNTSPNFNYNDNSKVYEVAPKESMDQEIVRSAVEQQGI